MAVTNFNILLLKHAVKLQLRQRERKREGKTPVPVLQRLPPVMGPGRKGNTGVPVKDDFVKQMGNRLVLWVLG